MATNDGEEFIEFASHLKGISCNIPKQDPSEYRKRTNNYQNEIFSEPSAFMDVFRRSKTIQRITLQKTPQMDSLDLSSSKLHALNPILLEKYLSSLLKYRDLKMYLREVQIKAPCKMSFDLSQLTRLKLDTIRLEKHYHSLLASNLFLRSKNEDYSSLLRESDYLANYISCLECERSSILQSCHYTEKYITELDEFIKKYRNGEDILDLRLAREAKDLSEQEDSS